MLTARTGRRLAGAVAASLAAVAAVTGCGGSGSDAGTASANRLAVVASFYPLQFVAQRIGGERIEVTALTKPGAEPHDLELTPQDVASVADATLVVYLSGFQPSVDEAVAMEAVDRSLDVRGAARLDRRYSAAEQNGAAPRTAGGVDPHFWLDPLRLRAVASEVGSGLARVDPAGAPTYARNAAALGDDLTALHADFRRGLRSCADRDLVTSHAAFGYLAQRYGLNQVGVAGLSPDAEPDPTQLADVATFVRTQQVRTIYTETLASPAVAETVATETGARTAVLDPVEGLTDGSAGRDYLSVMRADLATLRTGQRCA